MPAHAFLLALLLLHLLTTLDPCLALSSWARPDFLLILCSFWILNAPSCSTFSPWIGPTIFFPYTTPRRSLLPLIALFCNASAAFPCQPLSVCVGNRYLGLTCPDPGLAHIEFGPRDFFPCLKVTVRSPPMPHSLTDSLGEKTIWCVEFFLGVNKAKMAAEVSPSAASAWGRGWPPPVFLLLLPFFLAAQVDQGCKKKIPY